ncbi:MAG: hypothetical protein H6586_08820 [Flavobacteriales bacterium]|nr:hypothetical protein [Flavobacteriales bacterium]
MIDNIIRVMKIAHTGVMVAGTALHGILTGIMYSERHSNKKNRDENQKTRQVEMGALTEQLSRVKQGLSTGDAAEIAIQIEQKNAEHSKVLKDENEQISLATWGIGYAGFKTALYSYATIESRRECPNPWVLGASTFLAAYDFYDYCISDHKKEAKRQLKA